MVLKLVLFRLMDLFPHCTGKMTLVSEVQLDVIWDSGHLLDMPYVTCGRHCQDLLHSNSLENGKILPESPRHIVLVEQEDPCPILVHT